MNITFTYKCRERACSCSSNNQLDVVVLHYQLLVSFKLTNQLLGDTNAILLTTRVFTHRTCELLHCVTHSFVLLTVDVLTQEPTTFLHNILHLCIAHFLIF